MAAAGAWNNSENNRFWFRKVQKELRNHGDSTNPCGTPIARGIPAMERRAGQLTVVIGASSIAEQLRRTLMQHDVAHVGITTHLRGLRRSMVMGQNELVVVCIALDQTTIARHGKAVRQLLADHHCRQQVVRSVGLLSDLGLNRDAAELGCDVYVDDSAQAAKAITLLARRWQNARARAIKAGPSARKASGRSLARSWTWGTNHMPIELAPLMSSSKDETPSIGSPATRARVRRASQGIRNRKLKHSERKRSTSN
jgi:hypothetical protein